MAWDGDWGWLGTLVLFGPRWMCAIPLVPLAVVAGAIDRRMLLPLAVTALFIIGPIMGVETHLGGSSSTTHSLRVMTCNVDENTFNTQSLAYLIATEEPDVVALQEVSSATRFSWPPGWTVLKHDEFILASRFPIAQHELVNRVSRMTDNAAIRYIVERLDGPVQIFNVHLESPRPGIEAVLGGPMGVNLSGISRLEDVLRMRAVESAVVSRWIAGFDGPKIVLGDFNMPCESTIYRATWASWGNAFSATGWGFGYTKRSQFWGTSYGTRIDHVLFSPEWNCAAARLGQDIGSDHLPLIADFR